MISKNKIGKMATVFAIATLVPGLAAGKSISNVDRGLAQLQVGQKILAIAKPTGQMAARAKSIEIIPSNPFVKVVGKVEAVDLAARSMTILGVKVFARRGLYIKGQKIEHAATGKMYKPRFKFSELKVGWEIKAMGALRDDGSVQANGLGVVKAEKSGMSQIYGPIQAIDTEKGTMTILGVKAHIAADVNIRLNKLPNLQLSDLSVGDRAKIKGQPTGPREVMVDEVKAETAKKTAIEGPILADRNSPNTLKIMGVKVVPADHAAIIDPLKEPMELSAFPSGRHAHADGEFGEDGTFHAVLVRLKKFKDPDWAEITGVVQAIDPVNKTVTVMGITISLARHTYVYVGK